MRKIGIFFTTVLVALLAGIAAVNLQDMFGQENRRVRLLSSFYPMYIMALNVAAGIPGVSVENLTPPFTGCLHDYALTTDDMKKIAGADIFIANGAGMEAFLDKVIAQYPGLKVINLTQGVRFIKEGLEVNPHVWVSISDAIAQVNNLGRALEGLDPLNAKSYFQNTAEYVGRLETLREKMRSELAPYKGRQIVTFHEAFSYFAQEFGLKIAAVVKREPASEPSAKELAQTIDLIKRLKIKALFSEPQYPTISAEAIAKETGAKVYILDPAVTGPDNPDAYIKIMEENLKVLKEAFKPKSASKGNNAEL